MTRQIAHRNRGKVGERERDRPRARKANLKPKKKESQADHAEEHKIWRTRGCGCTWPKGKVERGRNARLGDTHTKTIGREATDLSGPIQKNIRDLEKGRSGPTVDRTKGGKQKKKLTDVEEPIHNSILTCAIVPKRIKRKGRS